MKRSTWLTLGIVVTSLACPALGQPCNPGWVNKFPGGDFDGAVRAATVFNDGKGEALYVAGSFSRAGGIHAQGVAKWTGSGWAPVGGDFNADVNALLVHTDGSLYVGGAFSAIGGISAPRVARWNGSAWVAMGTNSTMGGTVLALTSFPDANGMSRVWAGGSSLWASGTLNSSAMWWNGTAWIPSDPSGAVVSSICSFAVINEQGTPRLYMGAGGSDTAAVRRWTGTAWEGIGPSPFGERGPVNALAAFDDGTGTALYAAGGFFSSGGGLGNHIARWNGQTWSTVGIGLANPVNSLAVFDPDGPGPEPARLFAGGGNPLSQNLPTPSINYWNGNDWIPFASTQNPVLVLTPFGSGSSLFAGGNFPTINGVTASRTAFFSSAGWHPMSNGDLGNAPAGLVNCMAWFDDDGAGPHPSKLYVGGDFQRVGSAAANYIAVWDGASWSSLPDVFNGSVWSMKVFDDGSGQALYVGGISYASRQSVVVRWNGSSWSGVGNLVGQPAQLELFRPAGAALQLYACGSFSAPGTSGTVGIVRWNGSAWSTVGSGMNTENISAMQAFDDGSGPKLFVCDATNVFTPRVYTWDGTAWALANAGISNQGIVRAFTVYDDGTGSALYGAGFSPLLRKWTGTSWIALPGSVNFEARSAAVHDDGTGPALYVGGALSIEANTSLSCLARWKNSTWSNFAPTAQPSGTALVQALLSVDSDGSGPAAADLFVGGSFTSIGGISSGNLAEWSACGCYPNCDRSTALPLLNANDFNCFLNKFAAGDPYANCDNSTTSPILNAADFQCFLNQFAAGCQ